MGRKLSKNPKNKVIQIRVTEEIYNKFNKFCEEELEETSSTVGYNLIKTFLVVNNV